MSVSKFASWRGLSGLLALGLWGCPTPTMPTDTTTMDAALDGARGLVTWAARVCQDDGGCGPRSNHASNTGLNGVGNASALRCTMRRVGDATMVQFGLGFAAQETTDTSAHPGSLELRGSMMATSGAVAPGTMLTDCLVTVQEGSVSASASCSGQCVATLTNYFAESGTLTGSVRCAALGSVDSGVPHLVLTQADGVPGTTANFSIAGCELVP